MLDNMCQNIDENIDKTPQNKDIKDIDELIEFMDTVALQHVPKGVNPLDDEIYKLYDKRFKPVVEATRNTLNIKASKTKNKDIKKEAGSKEATEIFISETSRNLKDAIKEAIHILQSRSLFKKRKIVKHLEKIKDIRLVAENKTVWVSTFDVVINDHMFKLRKTYFEKTGKYGQCIINTARTPYIEYLYEFPMLDFRGKYLGKDLKKIFDEIYKLYSTHKVYITVGAAAPILMELACKAPVPTRNIPLFNEYLNQKDIGYLEFYLVDKQGRRPPQGVERDRYNLLLSEACASISQHRYTLIQNLRATNPSNTSDISISARSIGDDIWMQACIKHAFCTQGEHCMCSLEHKTESCGERFRIAKTVSTHLNKILKHLNKPNIYKLEFIQPYPFNRKKDKPFVNISKDKLYDLDSENIKKFAKEPEKYT